MKKSKKLLALLFAVVMVIGVSPISAFAATDLTKEVNVLKDSEYYNVSLNNGDSGDYINFEYTGVTQDGVWYVTPDTDLSLTITDSVGYTGENFSTHGYNLGWYYGTSTSYYLYCDTAWTMTGTDNDYSFTMSTGVGTGVGDSWKVYAGTIGNSMESVFTLEGGLPAGTYTFDVTYKLQMKKQSTFSSSTAYELSTTDTITIIATDVDALGGSIRVSDPAGLRFGFSTDIDADTIDEYGFYYVYDAVDTVTADTANVKQKVATNQITHNEDTDDEYTTFNLVFTNVPTANFDTDITACAYIVVDGVTYYSEPMTRNFTQVANAVLADESVDDDTKSAVQDMLNA